MLFLMKWFATLRNFYTYKIDILINLVLLCFAAQKQNKWCYRVLDYESMTELSLHIKVIFQSSVLWEHPNVATDILVGGARH